MFCLVFITSQRWTCLVSGSVLVKHVLSGVLSGVCDVTMMYVSCCRLRSCQACSLWCLRCYNACILLQILFLLRESGVCSVRGHGVHAMLQQCILLQILFLLRESGVCSVRDHGVHAMLQQCILLQILFLLRESGVCSVRDHGVHAMLQQCICRRFCSC